MKTTTLHIAQLDKFIPPFIEFIREEFPKNGQKFITYGDFDKFNHAVGDDAVYISKSSNRMKTFGTRYGRILFEMYRSDKVILHGLFDIYLVAVLFSNPWLLKKCYWIIWGGDLYKYRAYLNAGDSIPSWAEFMRKSVIKRLGNLVSYLDGDINLARKVYGARGQHIRCNMYLSNVFTATKETCSPHHKRGHIKVLVGNSSDPSNNHIDALNKLIPFKSNDIEVIIPLSYGDKNHAENVIEYAKEKFGEKVRILTDFIDKDEYMTLLNTIDIAIFNHDRQQAMGNTISLLGMGKTVYIKDGTSQWDLFDSLGVNVKNVSNFDLQLLSTFQVTENIDLVKEQFSKQALVEQYRGFLI